MSLSQRKSSKQRRGKHRKQASRPDPHAWLGAGALTLGIGAAALVGSTAGAGTAQADDAPTSGYEAPVTSEADPQTTATADPTSDTDPADSGTSSETVEPTPPTDTWQESPNGDADSVEEPPVSDAAEPLPSIEPSPPPVPDTSRAPDAPTAYSALLPTSPLTRLPTESLPDSHPPKPSPTPGFVLSAPRTDDPASRPTDSLGEPVGVPVTIGNTTPFAAAFVSGSTTGSAAPAGPILTTAAVALSSRGAPLSLAMATTTAAAASSRTRSHSADGQVYLGGDYIELGVHTVGSIGTIGTKPEDFHPPRSGVGFVSDLDGFENGVDAPIDFFLPDTPEERWSIGYNGSERGSFSGLTGSQGTLTDTSVADTSTGDKLSATAQGTANDVLKVRHDYSFGSADKGYLTTVTLTNTSDETLTDVTYMRSFDPDNSRDVGGANTTINTVGGQHSGQGYALVTAASLPDDAHQSLTGEQAVVYLFSSDPRAEVYSGGFRNTDPYAFTGLDQAAGTTTTADDAIGIVYQIGDLAPGQSVTFSYYTGATTHTDPAMILGELGTDPTSPVKSPVADYGVDLEPIKSLNALLRSQSFSDVVSFWTNITALTGFQRVNKALTAVAAFVAGYSGNLGASAGLLGQSLGNAISASAAANAVKYAQNPVVKRASGVVFLAGAAVTTWSYVAEQASYIDPDSTDETFQYIREHPLEAVREGARATGKVLFDLGSSIVGSLW